MDNKQKKKFYKLIYKTAVFFGLICAVFAIGLCTKTLIDNTSIYLWLEISIIVIAALGFMSLLIDCSLTNKMKNKFSLAKFIYFIVCLTVVGVIALFVAYYLNEVVLTTLNIIVIGSLLGLNAILVVVFVLGLKLSKLYQNTTITIDSTSEIPNFDDELYLKKKLDELNRKLEMKKVQEKIDAVEHELDEK